MSEQQELAIAQHMVKSMRNSMPLAWEMQNRIEALTERVAALEAALKEVAAQEDRTLGADILIHKTTLDRARAALSAPQ